jgi:hypothetical protein
MSRAQREPAFADPTPAEQRDHGPCPVERPNRLELATPPDEARELDREAARRRLLQRGRRAPPHSTVVFGSSVFAACRVNHPPVSATRPMTALGPERSIGA